MDTTNFERYKLNTKYMIEHEMAYVVQESDGEILLNNFVFGANSGFYTSNSTNLSIIGGGADQSVKGLRIAGKITNGQFVNMMLVTRGGNVDERDVLINGTKQHMKVETNIDTNYNAYLTTHTGFTGFASIVNPMGWGNSKQIAIRIHGSGNAHVSGGIFNNTNDDNTKPFVRIENNEFMMVGTIFAQATNSDKEINSVKANSTSALVCPLCYDGNCNIVQSTSSAKVGLYQDCYVK